MVLFLSACGASFAGSRGGPVEMESRIKELRVKKNWSQSDLAEQLDVSRQTVNSIERDKYDPSLPLAFKIAAIFDLTIEDVFIPEKGNS